MPDGLRKSPVVSRTAAANPPSTNSRPIEFFPFAVALVFGAINGLGEVAVGDLLLTGFLALAFTMVLGFVLPRSPWRWTLAVCTCVPLARVFAAFVLHRYTPRAQIYEAFLVFLPGVVGAYGGFFLRRVIKNIAGRN